MEALRELTRARGRAAPAQVRVKDRRGWSALLFMEQSPVVVSKTATLHSPGAFEQASQHSSCVDPDSFAISGSP